MDIKGSTVAIFILIVCIVLVIKVQPLKPGNSADGNGKTYLQISMYISWLILLLIVIMVVASGYNSQNILKLYWGTIVFFLLSIFFLILGLSKVSGSPDPSITAILYWIIFVIIIEVLALASFAAIYYKTMMKLSSINTIKTSDFKIIEPIPLQ